MYVSRHRLVTGVKGDNPPYPRCYFQTRIRPMGIAKFHHYTYSGINWLCQFSILGGIRRNKTLYGNRKKTHHDPSLSFSFSLSAPALALCTSSPSFLGNPAQGAIFLFIYLFFLSFAPLSLSLFSFSLSTVFFFHKPNKN